MIDDANLSREGERRKEAILILAKQAGQRRRDRRVATRWGIMMMFCAGGLFATWQIVITETARFVQHAPTPHLPTREPVLPIDNKGQNPAVRQQPEFVKAPDRRIQPARDLQRPPHLQPARPPVVISKIKTDPGLRQKLSIARKAPLWEKIDDQLLIEELRLGQIPAGLAIVAGKSQLIYHDRPLSH